MGQNGLLEPSLAGAKGIEPLSTVLETVILATELRAYVYEL